MTPPKPNIDMPNPTVGLFVSCIVDVLYPKVGLATEKLLVSQGVEVVFPQEQTCCGQPAFNAGQQKDSLALAKNFLNTFAPMIEEGEISSIVVPSGSCAAMIKHSYAAIIEKYPSEEMTRQHQTIEHNTYELSEYLVEVLGVEITPSHTPLENVAYHPCCHLLRDLKIDQQPRQLLEKLTDNKLLNLPEAETCCGFGGLFSLWNEEISVEMGLRKASNLKACGAELVAVSDAGCMTHLNGILIKEGHSSRAIHIAELIADNGLD